MIHVERSKIAAIEYVLPEKTVTNQDLETENPTWDLAKTAERAGIFQRQIAALDETALDLAKKACHQLLAKHPDLKEKIDGIIFCTQSPDYIMPSNAHLIHDDLGLGDRVMAFDFNLACSGYIYGLAMANSFIESGLAHNILFITADTYSKYIHPQDRSTRILFGDGAAVTWLTTSQEKFFFGFELSSHGKGHDKFCIPAGGLRTPKSEKTKETQSDLSGNVRSLENIHMKGMAVWSFINTVVPQQIYRVLDQQKLSIDKVDCFIFHQASKMTLESLIKILGVSPEKVFLNLERIGNTVSASIPIALKDAMDQKVIKVGDTVLLSGFGVGLSYGTVVVKF